MVVDVRPRQADFEIVSEDWGKAILTDGSEVFTRVILADLTILSEDLLGKQFATSNVVALRVRSPQSLKDKIVGAPIRTPIEPLPLTEEAGFERVNIDRVEKPTISRYRFNGNIITIELTIKIVIRNMNYRIPNGSPVYHVRWNVESNIEEEHESS